MEQGRRGVARGSRGRKRWTRFARFGCASAAALVAAPVAAEEATPAPTELAAVEMPAGASASKPALPISGPMAGTGDGLSLSLGGSLREGRFGTSRRSRLDSVLANLRYRTGPLRLDASLPWISIRTPGIVYSGIDGTPLIIAPDLGGPRRRYRGIGDLTLGARWLAGSEEKAGVDVELAGQVKLPTAGRGSGLSSDKVDYAVSAEVSKSFGRVVPTARLGYRVFGDPKWVRLRDGFSGSLGVAYLAGPRVFVLGSYDYAQRASRFVGDAHEATLAASAPIGQRLRLSLFGSAGLSRGAPALSSGLSLTVALGR